MKTTKTVFQVDGVESDWRVGAKLPGQKAHVKKELPQLFQAEQAVWKII